MQTIVQLDFDLWECGARAWRLCVRRGWKRYIQQENMMTGFLSMHRAFFRIFQHAGASFDPDPLNADEAHEKSHACHCGRCFSTPQGLACHKRLQHGEFAPEHEMISGTTCPECLKFFWTKQRLYQHLSYISRTYKINACFQALKKRGFCLPSDLGEYHKFPNAVRGLARVETLQTLGPLPAPPQQDVAQGQLDLVEQELTQIDLELTDIPQPPDVPETTQQLWDFLTDATHCLVSGILPRRPRRSSC
eukprot:s3467_g5.t1